jgi:selenocysteine lyase/cysteine desulfurase
MSPQVLAAMAEYMALEAAYSSTEAMLASSAQLGRIYHALARLTNVPSERVALFSSNTEAWQKPFLSLDFSAGDRILVGESEWGGNLSLMHQIATRTGARIEVIPSTNLGVIDTVALGEMLDENVRAVCVTWLPAVHGAVNPAAQIAEVLDGHDAWLFVDAAQYFGQVGTDLSHPRFDVVTVSPRKYLRAPRGAGFSCFSARFLAQISPRAVDQFAAPWKEDGPEIRTDARKFEYGETSYMVRIGLATALDAALKVDWCAVQRDIKALAAYTRAGLSQIAGITVAEHPDAPLSGQVTFSHATHPPAHFVQALAAQGINIAAPAPAYAPFWFAGGRVPICRLSPHTSNTRSEIDRALAAIKAAI